MQRLQNIHHAVNEYRRYLRDDRVTITAQSSHAIGYPVNQRLKAGFNWPGFPVSTGDKHDIIPDAHEFALQTARNPFRPRTTRAFDPCFW